ncbi:hypothetical protein [Colwellia hornerae]|nr:hypothetical protein [Colwellia hornerae]
MPKNIHPEHIRSLPSMAPRYTVHPEHKKAAERAVQRLFRYNIKTLSRYS